MAGMQKYVKLIESIEKQAIAEGVRIGNREIEATLKNSQNFQMGIEYEVYIPPSENFLTRYDAAHAFVKEYNIKHIDNIVEEHDSMVEMITGLMSIKDGLQHMKHFFEAAEKGGVKFPNTAGLHLSISHKDSKNKEINFTKFLVLLSGDYLHSIFPERHYVENIDNAILNVLKRKHITSLSVAEDEINLAVANDDDGDDDDDEITLAGKYITAKLSDYFDMNGRIELRFFGGENYDKMYEEIRWQLLRSVYILELAYEPNMFRKEYLTRLYKLLEKGKEVYKTTGIGLIEELLKDYDGKDPDISNKIMNAANEYIEEKVDTNNHEITSISSVNSQGEFLVDVDEIVHQASDHLGYFTGEDHLDTFDDYVDFDNLYEELTRPYQAKLVNWLHDTHANAIAEHLGLDYGEVDIDIIEENIADILEEIDDDIASAFRRANSDARSSGIMGKLHRDVMDYINNQLVELHLRATDDILESAKAIIINNHVIPFIESLSDFELEDYDVEIDYDDYDHNGLRGYLEEALNEVIED